MTDTPTASTSYPTSGYSSLTDSQLQQTFTQLSNARDNFQHYVSPAPQANAKGTGSSLAPPPQPAHVPPTYQPPVHVAPVAPAAPVAPLIPPNPPRHPLPVTPQALHSTFASRIRTGTTLLVQPILSAPTAVATRSSRRGGLVNYADPGSGDDIPDAGALDSDDSDFIASGGTRTAIRQTRTRMGTGMNVFAAGSGVSTPQPQPQASRSNDKSELDQSYLGMIPPSKFIRAKPTAPTAHEYPSEDAIEAQARRRTALVPIRVEFETDTHRIRDCFVWNLYESLIKPETFAKIFCNDLDLPAHPWVETVTNQIRAQLEEHEGVASMDLAGDARMNTDPSADSGEETAECRVVLSIDVQISTHHLLDHIEWDLLSPLTPEAFSRQLCNDLGLSGEAIPLVAHAIHEELMKHKKDAIEWGVIGGDREVPEDYASDKPRDKSGLGLVKDKTGLGLGWGRTPKDGRGPKVLRSVWRDWPEAEEFRTRFEVLSAEEVERREIEKERASRRLRRETSKFQTNTRTRRR
ncbi:hypothetical protein BJ138DRAFT_1136396 [Hygrophoropsis aurantiaca]|uniref:Uncharacterized protein n=1 Tax=Hygrophoropsis aurantiaca TaxID=72124 RepID=A0ACB8A8N7_9AGAM|nr:hypothetical protein BJ138DRAFT_1136396 [Hygrophoropsis aurantiaca]